MTTLQDADRIDPSQAEAEAKAGRLLQQGIAAAGRGAPDEAIACMREAVAWRPGLAAAQANLGLLLVAIGRHAEAEAPLGAAIGLMPRDAVLRNALGIVLEALQRFEEAGQAYRAALEIDPRLAEAHANLGNCLRRLGHGQQAEAHYVRAIELRPEFAVARYNLGILLQEREQFDRAIVQYREAVAHRPDYVEALINLGSSLRSAGAIDEARATFERVLQIQPLQIEAHCNLSQFKTYRADDPHVGQLLSQQFQLPSMNEEGRIRYWFTIGKMMDDIGRHEDAFAAYAEGNRLKRGITRWDEAGHMALQRRIVAAFTRERLAAPVAPAAEGPTPVFIVGMPRSGTSLLEQVLATLPNVHGAGELTWLPEILYDDAGQGIAGFPDNVAGYSAEDHVRRGRRYIERIRELAPQATHVVDKLPDNFQHLGLIHLMFPGARIIHSMRDPMDSCFSCFSRLFIGDNLAYTYDLDATGRYWVAYHDLMRHWHAALPAGRILDVSYETMVGDFENQARRLVAYLGLPWDERCLGFHENRRIVKTASVAQVRKPIYRTSVARWKPYERHLGALLARVRDYR